MLALLKESFPADVMYKSGARLESRAARVFFRFPDVAKLEHANTLSEFQRRSGWNVELNDYPDTSSFRPLLRKLIGSEADKIKKISWNIELKRVTLTLSAPLNSATDVTDAFAAATGYDLIPRGDKTEISEVSMAAPDAKINPKCTQQEVMRAIDDIFAPEGITIYKKSIRAQATTKHIELQFLTPALGRRYEKWLRDIYEMTGWPLTSAPHPRQQELIMLARQCAADCGVALSKTPSIRQNEQCVEISVALNTDSKAVLKAQTRFSAQSGYQLRIR